MKVQHAELGVDGNCGFALLGENLQEGEAEFVEIKKSSFESIEQAEDRASRQAFNKLRERLDPERAWLTYWIGPSHPRHC